MSKVTIKKFGERLAELRADSSRKLGKKVAQKTVAKEAGIGDRHYQTIEAGDVPNGDTLLKIVNYFKCSLTWLLLGIGPKYMCDMEAEKYQTPRTSIVYPKPEELDRPHVKAPGGEVYDQEEDKIADALTMTTRVLKSGTSYATALYLNIQHFDRAIRTEIRMTQLEKRFDDLERKIAGNNPGEALTVDKVM